MKKRIAVIWHQKMEEIEGVTPVDLLRRAGLDVAIFSANNELTIIGSHQIKLFAEYKLKDLNVNHYEAIVFIGGPGTDTLLTNKHLVELTLKFHQKNKLIGAICASPQILGKAGLAKGLQLTHFPGANKFLDKAIDLSPKALVITDNIITSAGPGTAFDYSLALIEALLGKEAKDKIKSETVYQN